jgi:hypothetical protein
LHPHGFEKSLDFSFAFRGIGGGVEQGDAQAGTGIFEPVASKDRAVVDEMPNSAFRRLCRRKTNAEVPEYLLWQ